MVTQQLKDLGYGSLEEFLLSNPRAIGNMIVLQGEKEIAVYEKGTSNLKLLKLNDSLRRAAATYSYLLFSSCS